MDDEQFKKNVADIALGFWKDKKEELLKEIQAKSSQLPQLSSKEIVTQQQELIKEWISKSIDTLTPTIVKQSLPDVPTSEDIVRQQEELIKKWITNNIDSKVPQLITGSQMQDKAQINKLIESQTAQAGHLIKLTERLDYQLKEDHQLDERAINAIVAKVGQDKIATMISDAAMTEIVRKQLELFAADRLNRTDYAALSSGGRIIHVLTSHALRPWTLLNWATGSMTASPDIVLTPGAMPGQCFAFAGHHGTVAIQLGMPIVPSSFSLDHISPGLALNFGSAPKNFVVWGLKGKYDPNPALLGNYTYVKNGPAIQTFNVQKSRPEVCDVVVLEIESNYGNKELTCIYRFRVHGTHIVPDVDSAKVSDEKSRM